MSTSMSIETAASKAVKAQANSTAHIGYASIYHLLSPAERALAERCDTAGPSYEMTEAEYLTWRDGSLSKFDGAIVRLRRQSENGGAIVFAAIMGVVAVVVLFAFIGGMQGMRGHGDPDADVQFCSMC
jgi:hypothetical protein